MRRTMAQTPESGLEAVIAQQRALLEIARSEERDLDQLLRRVLQIDARTLGVERVGYWEYSPDRGAIVCRLMYELSNGTMTSGAVLLADRYPRYFRALEELLVVPADDALGDARTNEYRDDYLAPNGIGAMMDVPVWRQGRVHGILCHEHVGPARHWFFGEQLFAASMANFVSLALETRESEVAVQQTQALKRSILSNLSHEVRTPLHVISGNVELLRGTIGGVGDGVVSMLDAIDRSSRRLVRTIESLLDLARAESGTLTFQPQPTRLGPLVRRELADFVMRAEARGLWFRFETAADAVVSFDPYALAAALRAVADNAVKFTETGGVTVSVSSRAGEVACVVRDTGIGIARNFLDRLFLPFEQADGGIARRYEGTGIGLALARAFLERGGASIAIESEEGTGTAVRMSFRAADADPPREGAP